MKKLIQNWLGIVDSNDFIERIRDLESKCDDLKYEQENLEYNLNELGKYAEILADAEGLDAHRMSMYLRRKLK